MSEPGQPETETTQTNSEIKELKASVTPENPAPKEAVAGETEKLKQLHQELVTKPPRLSENIQIQPTIVKYGQNYAEIAESRYGKGLLAKHGEVLIKTVEKSFPENAVVLEVGCNTGMFMKQLEDSTLGAKIKKLSGIDVNKDAVDTAKQRGFDASLGDAQNLENIPDASIDTLFSMHTYEHVPDLHKAFREISRVLKPEGKAYLILPPNLYGLETIKVAAEDLPEDKKGRGLFGRIKTFINAWRYARKLHCSSLGGPFGGAKRDAEKIIKELGITNLAVTGGMGLNPDLAFANLLVFEKLSSS